VIIDIKKNIDFYVVSKFLIFFISIIYSILIGSGQIGFGIDYLAVYHKSNVRSHIIFDYIGWLISTLQINNIHLGAYAVSFIISLSVGFISRTFFNIMKLNSLFFFTTTYLLILFSWPVIISSNNAMRQGLMMAFIYFSLVRLYEKKIYSSIFIFCIALFTHKSAIGYLFVFIYFIFFSTLMKSTEISRKSFLKFGLIIFFISVTFLTISNKWDHDRFDSNVMIGINFVPFFLLINIIYVFYYTIRYNFLINPINLYLYFFSFNCLALIPSGLFWQFERYNMTLIIIFIFSFAISIKKSQKYIYLTAVLVLLFILTFLTGQYTEGMGIFPFYKNN
jgi:hypothetical protein